MNLTIKVQNWSKIELSRTMVSPDGSLKIKIITGKVNGGGKNCAYIFGDNGWSRFIDISDITFDWGDVSYVSDEDRRKLWAEQANEALKIAVETVYS